VRRDRGGTRRSRDDKDVERHASAGALEREREREREQEVVGEINGNKYPKGGRSAGGPDFSAEAQEESEGWSEGWSEGRSEGSKGKWGCFARRMGSVVTPA
jgi:hypothetical protein